MAKQIVTEPTEIPAVMTANRFGGRRNDPDSQIMVPRRMSIEELSFAGHVDYIQNSGFIEEVGAKVVILVHGEQNNMGRLKSALLSKNHEKKEADRIKIYNPKNCEELKIPFRGEKFAKVCFCFFYLSIHCISFLFPSRFLLPFPVWSHLILVVPPSKTSWACTEH
jgi:cleavage and polyadenylation specificity factor subunit 3